MFSECALVCWRVQAVTKQCLTRPTHPPLPPTANGVYDKTSSVRGLTTAAAIWVSAAVGVCAGTGLYFVGLVAALSTIAILRVGKVGGFDHESREEQKERDEEEKLRKVKEQEKVRRDKIAQGR